MKKLLIILASVILLLLILILGLKQMGFPIFQNKPIEITQNWSEMVSKINKMELGDKKSEVLEKLGAPDGKSQIDSEGRQTFTYRKLEQESTSEWVFIFEFNKAEEITRIDEFK